VVAVDCGLTLRLQNPSWPPHVSKTLQFLWNWRLKGPASIRHCSNQEYYRLICCFSLRNRVRVWPHGDFTRYRDVALSRALGYILLACRCLIQSIVHCLMNRVNRSHSVLCISLNSVITWLVLARKIVAGALPLSPLCDCIKVPLPPSTTTLTVFYPLLYFVTALCLPPARNPTSQQTRCSDSSLPRPKFPSMMVGLWCGRRRAAWPTWSVAA